MGRRPAPRARCSVGRGGRIRTSALLLPKQAPWPLGYTAIVGDPTENRTPAKGSGSARLRCLTPLPRMVEARGLEPRSAGYQPAALPLSYASGTVGSSPKRKRRAIRGLRAQSGFGPSFPRGRGASPAVRSRCELLRAPASWLAGSAGVEPASQAPHACILPLDDEPLVDRPGLQPGLRRCGRRVLALTLPAPGARG